MSDDPPQLHLQPPLQCLKGKRIVVTRAGSQASSLVAALTDLGAEVIELPTIETVPLESYETLGQALKNIAQYQWLIVTSANTVRVLVERLSALGLPLSALASPRKVAIGSATAKAMREQGIEVNLIPEQYVAESLLAAMDKATERPHKVEDRSDNSFSKPGHSDDRDKSEYPSGNSSSKSGHSDDQREEEPLRTPHSSKVNKLLSPIHPIEGSRVLLVRATIARDLIPEELNRRGAIVDVIDAYKTVIPVGSIERMRKVFADPANHPDAITFTSSSTVKNFFTLWEKAGFSGLPECVAAISIGPVTSETLRGFSWEPACEATRHDVEGLAEAVIQKFAGNDCGT
jgi:uroporphyrinogen-III synthase